MKRCVFLTMANPEGFFVYDELAHAPLAKLGWQVDTIPWTQPDVDWNAFDLVVVRSTWDYQSDPERFLDVLATIDASTARLENSLDTIRWNINKAYLKQLEERAVPLVPTRWLRGLDAEQIRELQRELATDELVVKPLVGANADDTFRMSKDPAGWTTPIETFRDRDLMAQPFVSSIQSPGEYSLFYFGGEYSHCVLKTPAKGDFRVQEEHGSSLQSVVPDNELRTVADLTIRALDDPVLYARVDLVLVERKPALMELELIEPSLYFTFDAQSPGRFADAVERLG